MKKKILLSILCICMVLAMMPTVGYAAEKPVGDLYVNGELIYSSTAGATTGTVDGVSFVAETSTLTLTNANITNGYKGDGISVNFPLTIILAGTENKISIAPGTDNYGILANSDLTIKGGGTLQ